MAGASMKFVYIGIGIAAAVGAGYLAYRYLLSPQAKQEADAIFNEVQTTAKDAAATAKQTGRKVGATARDGYKTFESQVTP